MFMHTPLRGGLFCRREAVASRPGGAVGWAESKNLSLTEQLVVGAELHKDVAFPEL